MTPAPHFPTIAPIQNLDSAAARPQPSAGANPHAPPSSPRERADGWALADNDAAHHCARCGSQPRMVHHARRRGPRGWTDLPGHHLCHRCFAIQMAERRPPRRSDELDGRTFPWDH